MVSRNLAAIISTVIENEQIKSAITYLNMDEQIGFATVLLGCELTANELPQIPNNNIAKDVKVVNINPVKNDIEVELVALKKHDYKDGKWQLVDVEPYTRSAHVTYEDYMKFVQTGFDKI